MNWWSHAVAWWRADPFQRCALCGHRRWLHTLTREPFYVTSTNDWRDAKAARR